MTQYAERSAGSRTAAGPVAAQFALALLVAAAGAIHLYLYFDYFHRVHVVGVLFLVNAAAGLAIGAVLLVRRDRLVLLAALGYAVGTLAGFVVSTRWGLFGYHETFWGSWQEAAGGIELAAAFLAALLLARR
ncbi:MAG TPA: hypothetical protein VH541_00115 [Gaiellaceae bacterium]|jgi:hypothetical protein